VSQSSARPSEELQRLAACYGIETEYYDLTGELRISSEKSLIAVLQALGVKIDCLDDISAALQHTQVEKANEPISIVIVAWDGVINAIQIHNRIVNQKWRVLFELENGESISFATEFSIIEGELRFDKSIHLPIGYHRLKLSSNNKQFESLIVSAPNRCYLDKESPRRKWGLFAPLYSLKSNDDWGAGGFQDGRKFIEWIGNQGGKFWGMLPTLAAFLKKPCHPSPYWPISRLFWNEFFIDPTDSPEFKLSESAQQLVNSVESQVEKESLRSSELVDYSRVMQLKRSVLEFLAQQLFKDGKPARKRAFQQYLKTHSEVVEYAEFRALQENSSDRRMQRGKRQSSEETRQYYLYAQWIAEEQAVALSRFGKKAGVSLYLDLPVGIHPSGYDAWRYKDLFVWGASVGAPPDPLGPEGQNWGFPPLNPSALRKSGYDYFIKVVRRQMSLAGMLRVDHVMGFHRLFWIPKGMSGRDGVYVRYPADEFYAILSLESHRNRCEVVGEDLGTVPVEVRTMMREHNVKGLYVLPFEARLDTQEILRRPSADSVASLNTHDLVPFTGYIQSSDIHDRVEHGLTSESEVSRETSERKRFVETVTAKLRTEGLWPEQGCNEAEALTAASHRFLAESDAENVSINIEDLWGETEPQNRPGTVEPVPNWRRKLAMSIEEITGRQEFTTVLGEINNLRKQGGGSMSPRKASLGTTTTKRSTKKNIETSSIPIGTSQPVFRLTDEDKYLFNEGSHLKLYEKLGSHNGEVDGSKGCHFAVWAPDAASVHVIGDFNGWNRDSHPLFPNGQSGVWEGFIPRVGKTFIYKYYVRSRINGFQAEKADPFAFHAETSPKTGSIVWEIDHPWNDGDWMKNRRDHNQQNAPISIYEMHLGSWRRVVEDGDRPLSYREMAEQLPGYLKELGFTHVEFMPIMEHPFNGSWGYQTTGYFAPTSRFGTPQDFMALIEALHQAGIGVILDWVPSHFPTDGHGLAYFDGTHLYEHADGKQGYHPDWGSLIFNYGRNEVRSFLLSSAFYWLEKYHIDGLRVDAVASMLYLDYSRKAGEWIPNKYGGRENLEAISFLRRLNEEVYGHFPDVQMFAEESTSYPMVSRPTYLGGLGFGFKWDMGWMHDTLDYFSKDPIYRRFHHSNLTFRMLYAWHENFLLPLSHDEVVHGKGSLLGRMPGDLWQKFANLRLLYLAQFTQPGKKLLYMGSEIGQWAEWNHDRSLDWHLLQYSSHQGLQRLVSDLNRLYREESALHELDSDHNGFEWVDCNDTNTSTISFLRWSKDRRECILVVLNYTPETHFEYRIGVPVGGTWQELLNSDSEHYAGSGKGNFGEVYASGQPFHGRPDSLIITLPPLGGVVLKMKIEE